jgi:hypothetical protein
MRALVVSYSQSGETTRIAKIFADALAAAGVDVVCEEIQPRVAYPYPWRSIVRFFDAMPDAILGSSDEIECPHVNPSDQFELVVLAYPVWFLSPATPVQAFFRTRSASVLRNTDVITISVSRAMWQRASVAMKRLLTGAGAIHCDNIVVTHQGSPLATLISTPRTLLFGKRDRLLGVFPTAGVADKDLSRIKVLASVVARRLTVGRQGSRSFLRGEDAVTVTKWLAVPELLGWYCFRASAHVIRFFGTIHRGLRMAGVLGFAVFLVFLILFALPVGVLATFLATPFVGKRLNAYVRSLEEPSVSNRPTSA